MTTDSTTGDGSHPHEVVDYAAVADGLPLPEQLADALALILQQAHSLHPDDLGDLMAEASARIGATSLEIYLADLAQDVLMRYRGSGVAELEIDATIAGRAYRSIAPVAIENDDGTTLVWMPLLDGADRLGVVGFVIDKHDELAITGMEQICSLAAELLIARAQYGDGLALARRRVPLTLASEMRWALLPPRTFATDRVTIAAVVEPAYEVAGDSFDYSATGRTLHLAVFDAMGHGTEASRIVDAVVGAYRNARRRAADLAGIYRAIDAMVTTEFGESRFATGVLAEVEMDRGLLRVLRAGHPPPLVFRGHRCIGEIDVAPTMPFGVGDREPVVLEAQLEPDDAVLLYTDGVTEARNEEGEVFGVEQLTDFLGRAASAEEPLAETVRRLSKAIVNHRGTTLTDDATLLLLRWHRAAL
jgi:serine phosphatase RsbU (regulator of sigma subunit)